MPTSIPCPACGAHLRVGDTATRTAEVAAIVPKQARTGFITVLTMRHTIRRGGELIATEEFDAHLLEQPALDAPRGGPRALSRDSSLNRLMRRVQKRDLGDDGTATLDDWQTAELSVTTVRPQETTPVPATGLSAPGTRARSKRLSGSTAVWSHSSLRSRSRGSSGSHDASFWKTNPHFSSTWTSRVRGGKSHEFVVKLFGVGAGFGEVASHRVLVDVDQATGGARPAPLAEVLQDGEGFVVGQAGVFQDGPLALGEGVLAGAAVAQADPPALAAEAAEVEVLTASDAGIGAVGILTAEVLDGGHAGRPCSERSRGP